MAAGPLQGNRTARRRAVVVDECPLFRHGVAAVLAERGVVVAGQCDSAGDGLGLLRTSAVDLLVAGTPSGSGAAELVERSRAAVDGLHVVVLAPRLEPDALRRLLAAVPDALLTRNATVDEVAVALDRVADGERVVAPAHLATMIGSLVASQAIVNPLTTKETVVLTHLANGRSNKDIADAMVVSVATVKTHLSHIYEKLGVSDRREAVAKGIELRLLV